MEVGEEDLPAPQQRVFGGQRLFDLHHQLGFFVHCGVVADHRRARFGITVVGIARAGAGVALYQHLVAAFDELIYCRGQQGHPVFLVFDFFGDADDHKGME
jgi:hypothetical protein